MYSFYPTGPNVYPQMNITQPMQTLQPMQIPYVNDKQSAEAYQMPASSSVILMDSNQARFYLKQTDASGVATIKAFDFKEAESEKPVEYVTKAEFEKFKANMKGGRHESTNDANRKQ